LPSEPQYFLPPKYILSDTLNSVADASVALGRIGSFLTAEELADPYKIDTSNPYAVSVDGDFQWETTPKAAAGGSKFQAGKPSGGRGGSSAEKKEVKSEKNAGKRGMFGKKKQGAILPMDRDKDGEAKPEDKPFELKNLQLNVPKGSFVAIVGRVGSGKVRLRGA
jgi:ATP-binding cassette, subfamily C (CFTR/MRP), member 1